LGGFFKMKKVQLTKMGKAKIGQPAIAPNGKYVHIRQKSPKSCMFGSYRTIESKGTKIRICTDKKSGKRVPQSILIPLNKYYSRKNKKSN